MVEECGGVVKSIDFRVMDPLDADGLREWVQVWSELHTVNLRLILAMDSPLPSRLIGCLEPLPPALRICHSPFVVQDIPIRASSATRDAITPYGYGGRTSTDRGLSAVWSRWDQWARANGVLGLTVRSHLFSDAGILPVPGRCLSPLKNVVVDLSRSEEGIWSGYEGRARTDIRRGRELGVEIRALTLAANALRTSTAFTWTRCWQEVPTPSTSSLIQGYRCWSPLSPPLVVLSHAHADGASSRLKCSCLETKTRTAFSLGLPRRGADFGRTQS